MRTARGSNQPEDKRFRVQFSKKTDVSDPFRNVKIGNVLETAPDMFKRMVDNWAGTSPFHPMFLKLRTDLVTKAMTRTVPGLDLPGSCNGRQAHSFRAGFPLMHHDEQSYIDKYIAQARKTLTTEGDGEDSEEEQTPAGGGGAQAGAGSQDEDTRTPWGPVERLLPDLDACANATTSWIHLCCCGAALTSNIVDRMKELTAELGSSLIKNPEALSLQKLREVEYQVRETYDFRLQISQMQTTTSKRTDVSRQVPVPQDSPPRSATGSMAGSGATDESGTGADNEDASAAPNCVATVVPEQGGDSVNAAETGEDVPNTGGTQLQQSDPGHGSAPGPDSGEQDQDESDSGGSMEEDDDDKDEDEAPDKIEHHHHVRVPVPTLSAVHLDAAFSLLLNTDIDFSMGMGFGKSGRYRTDSFLSGTTASLGNTDMNMAAELLLLLRLLPKLCDTRANANAAAEWSRKAQVPTELEVQCPRTLEQLLDVDGHRVVFDALKLLLCMGDLAAVDVTNNNNFSICMSEEGIASMFEHAYHASVHGGDRPESSQICTVLYLARHLLAPPRSRHERHHPFMANVLKYLNYEHVQDCGPSLHDTPTVVAAGGPGPDLDLDTRFLDHSWMVVRPRDHQRCWNWCRTNFMTDPMTEQLKDTNTMISSYMQLVESKKAAFSTYDGLAVGVIQSCFEPFESFYNNLPGGLFGASTEMAEDLDNVDAKKVATLPNMGEWSVVVSEGNVPSFKVPAQPEGDQSSKKWYKFTGQDEPFFLVDDVKFDAYDVKKLKEDADTIVLAVQALIQCGQLSEDASEASKLTAAKFFLNRKVRTVLPAGEMVFVTVTDNAEGYKVALNYPDSNVHVQHGDGATLRASNAAYMPMITTFGYSPDQAPWKGKLARAQDYRTCTSVLGYTFPKEFDDDKILQLKTDLPYQLAEGTDKVDMYVYLGDPVAIMRDSDVFCPAASGVFVGAREKEHGWSAYVAVASPTVKINNKKSDFRMKDKLRNYTTGWNIVEVPLRSIGDTEGPVRAVKPDYVLVPRITDTRPDLRFAALDAGNFTLPSLDRQQKITKNFVARYFGSIGAPKPEPDNGSPDKPKAKKHKAGSKPLTVPTKKVTFQDLEAILTASCGNIMDNNRYLHAWAEIPVEDSQCIIKPGHKHLGVCIPAGLYYTDKRQELQTNAGHHHVIVFITITLQGFVLLEDSRNTNGVTTLTHSWKATGDVLVEARLKPDGNRHELLSMKGVRIVDRKILHDDNLAGENMKRLMRQLQKTYCAQDLQVPKEPDSPPTRLVTKCVGKAIDEACMAVRKSFQRSKSSPGCFPWSDEGKASVQKELKSFLPDMTVDIIPKADKKPDRIGRRKPPGNKNVGTAGQAAAGAVNASYIKKFDAMMKENERLKQKIESQESVITKQKEELTTKAAGKPWVNPKTPLELESLLAQINDSCVLSDELQPQHIAAAAIRAAKFWCNAGPHLKQHKNASWVGTLVDTATENEIMEPKTTTTRFENLLRKRRGDQLLDDTTFFNQEDTDGHVKDLHNAYKRRRVLKGNIAAVQEMYANAGYEIEWPPEKP